MMNVEGNDGNKPLGLRNVVSIGIEAMVGTGISALLGWTALLMEASTQVAFTFDGIVVISSGYVYARLGASYPSNGDIIDFSRHGLGNGVLSLALSLLYLLTLAMNIVMAARVLGAYAVQFLRGGNQEGHLILFYTSGITAVMTLFNSSSSHTVGRLGVILIDIKVMILPLLIIVGVWPLQPAHVFVSAPPSSGVFFSCIRVTFLAYTGLGMMANAADKAKDPQVITLRVSLVVIGAATLLYISLVLVLLGDASALKSEKYADTIVTQAASPLFRHVGYVTVVIGVLLVTASATNVNLLAVLNIMSNMDNECGLPKLMNKSLWRQSTRGSVVVAVSIMSITMALNLGSLASVANATFLVRYLVVFVVTIRLRHGIHASLPILIVGMLVTLLVIVGFIYSPWLQGSHALIWIINSSLSNLTMTVVMGHSKTVQHLSVYSTSCIIAVVVDIRTGRETCLDIY